MPCRYAFPLESLTVNTWPDLPARIQTAMKFPAVLATLNAIDAVVVVPASWLARWASAIPGVAGRTEKFTALLAAPPTVTSTFPVVVPGGTGTTMLVALQLVGVPDAPLKVTVLVPCVVPKFAPAIVTDVPTAPDVGFKLVMLGADEVTMKFTPLLMSPAEPPPLGALVTTTFPVTAPLGTGTTMLVALQLAGVPAVPLKVIVLAPCVAPKFAPLTVTDVPTTPDVGFRLVMLGGGGVTVKFIPLLATPPTVTTTLPVVAPAGTAATMLVVLQLAGVAATPLNFTVLVPCTAPKFAPLMVTDVPTTPDVGFRLVMLGGDEVTVKFIPLLATPPTVTTTFPVVAPAGAGTTMLVALQLPGVPAVPLKVAVPAPCVVPKFVPAMVTDVPTTPDVGFRLVILGGGGITAKFIPLLATLPTVTTTFPVVAPAGTGATMLVALQLVEVAVAPLKVSVLALCFAPKFAPPIVTDVPAAPDVGFRLVMLGGDEVTLKFIPLLATPPTVTTTLAVVAPAGAGATMLVALQLVGVPAVPLRVSVLVPCVAPKFAPVIATDVPSTPDVGFKLVILGGELPHALPGLKAAKVTPQLSGAARTAPADTVPAAICIRSSAISLVFGAAGTLPSMANPFPAVKLAE